MSGVEIWRPAPGHPHYEVSDLGRVRRVGGRPRATCAGEFGHRGLVVYEPHRKPSKVWVHRLVCEAFHGSAPTDGMHAAHGNGNPADNRAVNLRWATPTENAADKKLHGTEIFGERNGRSILTRDQVAEIRDMAASLPRSSGGRRIKKGSIGEISRLFGVSDACIRQVISGTRWKENEENHVNS